PSSPVATLAPPELSTTARALPPRATSRLHCTGAPTTRLVVNTQAATCCGPSLTTRARSGLPEGFSPAVIPAARKPCGEVTVTARLLRGADPGSRATPMPDSSTARPHPRCL